MSLQPTARLGPYEILASIGAGGMGEVYRATDTRLHREVAVKVSAERFSDRFEREARAVAALNHPNICTLFDVGPNYLVMELVEGDTLAERIKRGAIPIEEALTIARQIADALEAAHEKGVVHRDLKPANIKVKPDGMVKVLDFGLAMIADAEPGTMTENSPTLTLEVATRVGAIMGTAGYMAPEQARGKKVDKRADIFAFGVVLYEMLQGTRLFEGETVSDTLAKVLMQEPDLRTVPVKVQRLLGRCLEKDPKKRLRDIGEVWAWLEERDAPPRAQATSLRHWLWPSAAALFVATTALLAFLHFREQPPAAPGTLRFQIFPPEKTTFANFLNLSPDGRKLAFTTLGADGGFRPWVRFLDSLDARPVAESAQNAIPFWSPDSRFLGFQMQGKLRKVDAAGGPSVALCEAPAQFRGGAWSRDGVILFDGGSGLSRVSAEGGVPAPVTALDPARQESFHALQSFLPDGRHFLYLRSSGRVEDSGVYVGSLDAKPEQQNAKRLLNTPFGAVFAPSTGAGPGHVLFLRESTLMAQPFDTNRLELAGEPVPIAEQVGNFLGSYPYFSASATGSLIYRGGGGGASQLTWFDRQGKNLGFAGQPGEYSSVALSWDASRAAISRNGAGNVDIWLLEFARGGAGTRFTFDAAADVGPVWSPDGSQIVFSSFRKGPLNLYMKPSSGAGTEAELLKTAEAAHAEDWSRDGRFLLYTIVGTKTGTDLWVLPMDGDRKPSPFLATSYVENRGQFSPGPESTPRWIAYQSNTTGRTEIYVRPFPESSAGQWMVSTAGGTQPRWRRDGKELLYISPDRKLMSVEVSAGATFRAGTPKPLFAVPFFRPVNPIDWSWDVAADGRFLFMVPVQDAGASPITVVTNWESGLKK